MTEQEILQIEETFGVDLPGPYRNFLLSYPTSLSRMEASGWEVLNNPQRLLEINRLIDESHMIGWSDSFFAVGENGCGDYYAIDLNEDDAEVYFWDHEVGEIGQTEGFATVEEFAGHFLNPLKTVSQPWWKFWSR